MHESYAKNMHKHAKPKYAQMCILKILHKYAFICTYMRYMQMKYAKICTKYAPHGLGVK